MNRRQFSLIVLLIVTILWLPLAGQDLRLPRGFPDRSPDLNVLPGFKNPPKGYGEVSFYWWIGDPLTKERILRRIACFIVAPSGARPRALDARGFALIHAFPLFFLFPRILSESQWRFGYTFLGRGDRCLP